MGREPGRNRSKERCSLVVLVGLLHAGSQKVLRLVFLWPEHLNARVITTRVHLHELGDVELRFLEDLDLLNVDVLQGKDALSLLLYLLTDGLGDELLHQVPELHLVDLAGHDVRHLLADLADLGRLRVAVVLLLPRLLLGEGEAKEAHEVPVGGLHVHVGLDQRVPLADQGLLLVAGQLQRVEVRETVAALHLLDAELHLLVGLVLVVVQVRQVQLQHPPLQLLGGDLGALRARDQGLAAVADGEDAGRLDVVPLLLQERVARLLLAALPSSLGEALVLANSHAGSPSVTRYRRASP
mmetsp:Transcript_124303/g.333762  ORF Transcript_124303/g.333762 Transcript_124303/m.333762 type:complete len:297 (-) Transcript_124303:39-929(-)